MNPEELKEIVPANPHDDGVLTRSQGVLGYLIAFVVLMSLAALMAH